MILGAPLIDAALQTATTTTTTTASLDLAAQTWSYVLQVGSISGLILVALRIVEMILRRIRLEVDFGLELVTRGNKKNFDVTLRVRNKGQRSTSIEGVYFEWIGLYRGHIKQYSICGRLRSGLFKRRKSVISERRLELMEIVTGPSIGHQIGFVKVPVSLPIRIVGGTTRTFHTSLPARLPRVKVLDGIVCTDMLADGCGHDVSPREYHLVVETTHKKYVKELDPEILGLALVH
jgi:hypothetical protein